ncbi:2',5'-phosphodiesterase 12-like [Teleopsis dalmanni]|uniref:2',5'-phosphodiesterase 12-like n=1 Tax=Teleopsis dalmanni TaxID=139649 RepID=UPI0018CD82EF|nr:2',5'-phosphodiesterase 12-like [Teleopsis dalmanni]
MSFTWYAFYRLSLLVMLSKASPLLLTKLFKPSFKLNSATSANLFIKQIQRTAAHSHKLKYAMEKVYLRSSNKTDELHISFHYENEELRINKDFNFVRKMNEKVETALTRIRTKIENELNKRSKKSKKKTPAEVQEPVADVNMSEISLEFIYSGTQSKITDVTFAEMLQNTPGDLHMRVIDKTFQIVVNQPWIINLVLPTTVLAGYLVYPTKLEIQFAEKEYSRGEWFKAKMPVSKDLQRAEWELCGSGLYYKTKNEDIGFLLKFILTPANRKGVHGPPVENITKNPVEAGPGQCQFEMRHCLTTERLAGNALRVVSYNLLADLYADSDYSRTQLFPYCPPYALKIEYRKQLFLKEILGYNADIICLQEVDTKIFDLDLKPILELPEHNYDGIMAEKGSSGEGVATFYRNDRYELLKTYDVNLGENIRTLSIFEKLWHKISDNQKLVERICDRATTLQLTVLKCKENEKLLLVANTHLYFHPDADHIRLLQIGFSMLYVEHMYKQTLAEFNMQPDSKNLAIIFCGDFNSVPECGIYKLMTEKFVDKDFIDWRSNEEEAVSNVSLSQPFHMQSACGTPAYTNYTHLFAACLDYIFYQCDRLEVQQVVMLPTEEELKAHIAIPSVVFPSDHIALVADLKFK